jgi:exosortase C (VPDSG-CTERM-specific)
VTASAPLSGPRGKQWLAATSCILLLCFAGPLWQLASLALKSDLYSHIALIPFISAWLIWLTRYPPSTDQAAIRGWSVPLFVAGVGLLVWRQSMLSSGASSASEDTLALAVPALALILGGLCCLFLDRGAVGKIVFPLGFLLFMAPFPIRAREALESFLQHGSAAVALGLFRLAGTPAVGDGLTLRLAGINLRVAPECSGIHSSLALLITSVLAGRLFLKSTPKRVLLAAAVVPLALIRNGARIFTIGELCVHNGPGAIDSPIHQNGGPLFFALSLVPLLALLWFLSKTERIA